MPRNPHFDVPDDGAVWMGGSREVPPTLSRQVTSPAEPQPPKETVGDNGWMHRADDGTPQWKGRYWPSQWSLNPALWQNPATDAPTVPGPSQWNAEQEQLARMIRKGEPTLRPSDPPIGRSRAGAALHGQGAVGANAQIIERSLLERPANIRDAARALVKEIRDQVEQLQGSKANDEEGLAKHNEFVAFLERIAAGLAELADALDEAVRAGPNGPPEPIFLGKAARIAEQLNLGLMVWLEANRANVAGCTLRIGLIGAGYLFLNACGLSGNIAAIVSGLVNRGFSNKKTSTARAKKTSTTRAKKRPAKG